MRKKSIFISLLFLIFSAQHAFASEISLQTLQEQIGSLANLVKDLQGTVQHQSQLIESQNVKIQFLEKKSEERTISAKGFQQPVSSLSEPVNAPKTAGLSQGFNPDIGFVTSIQANSTQSREDADGKDTIALKEAELSISQYVDPYSRLDGIISFNDNLERQNVDVEEVYYTHWGLPAGFIGQIGKFRSKIGKANLLHSHQLDTVDYPLVIRNFFGDEGLASSGARLQNSIPNPWDIPLEVTGEILRGNNGNSFSGISRRPIFNTHVKTFFEMSKDSNLEFGWTTLFGDENPAINIFNGDGTTTREIPEAGQNKYGVKVFGGDATFNWYLPEGKTLKFQNEVYFQNRATETRHANRNPWGLYSLVDYRFSRRFSTGIRYDFLEPLDVNAHETNAISPYFTFWQSEFADFRLQYSYTRPAGGAEEPNHEVFLKANILIGAHKHPVQ